MNRATRLALTTAAALVAAACAHVNNIVILPPGRAVASVTIVDGTVSLFPGDTVRLIAVPRDASGAPVDSAISWVSSNTAIVSVSDNGLLTAITVGAVQVTAVSGGKAATIAVTVAVAPHAIAVDDTVPGLTVLAGATPGAISVGISNAGPGSLNGLSLGAIAYLSGPTTEWLSASLSTTTAPAALIFIPVTTGLAAGTYRASVQVRTTAAGVTNNPMVVTVTLTVNGFAGIAGGAAQSCAWMATGAAYCWGTSSTGDGMVGDATMVQRLTAVRIGPAISFADISAGSSGAGGNHICGRTAGGAGYCWGLGSSGQLAVGGQVVFASSPGPVFGAPLLRQIVAAGSHTCALSLAGTAFCWGANSHGQLGDGTTLQRVDPVQVVTAATFVRLTSRENHVCGVANDALTYCWGENPFGGLGDGTTVDRGVPTPVVGGHPFTQVAAGGFHTCGLTATGEAWCWGRNQLGQLGDGTTTQSPTPVRVTGGLSFVDIAAGEDHTCGRISTGATYCWGTNQLAQLGIGNVSALSSVPVPVAGSMTFTQVSPGFNHTCAVSSGLGVYCWGYNNFGQLGDGTLLNRFVPTAVRMP